MPAADLSPRCTVIKAGHDSLLEHFSRLLTYRDLFRILVEKEIRVRYKQTLLGFSWAIIQPFVSVIVFSFVFGKIARLDSQGTPYPLFNYLAMAPWTYFSSSFSGAATSLVGNAMIAKVYFPRALVPFAPILANLVDLAIAFAFVLPFLWHYQVEAHAELLFLPLLIAILVLFTAGISLFASALAIQFRDVKFAMPFLMQIMMYGAPVVFSAASVPAPILRFYSLYPMVGVIEGVRACFLPTVPMPWHLIGPACWVSAGVFLAGFWFFHRREHLFADIY